MKINVAHVANGQVASKSDPMSMLAGDENFSFASLLDLGGREPDTAHQSKGSRAKEDNSSKVKEGDEERSAALLDSKQGATSIPLVLQSVPNINAQPWQFNVSDVGARGNANSVSPSSLDAETSRETLAAQTRPQVANARTMDASASRPSRGAEKNAEKMPPFPDLNNVEPKKPSERLAVGDQGASTKGADANAKGAIAQPNDISAPSAAAPSSALTPGVGVASSAVNGASAPQGEIASAAKISVMQVPASAANHELKTDGKSQDPASSPGDPVGDAAGESRPEQAKLSAPLQTPIDAVSHTSAGSGGQGNGADAHHGSSAAKDALADSHVSVQQTPQSGGPGTSGSGSAHGHSVSTNSPRFEAAPETPHSTQFKAATLPGSSDTNAARLLGSAMRGDLRVGVQTEAFGRVTIQTNAQGGQLSAQLSLENAKDSAALAAHLPGVEQKIVQQQGLNASVRLVGGFDAGAGSGSMGREQSGSSQRNANAVMVRPDRVASDSLSEGRGAENALLGSRYVVSSRLDVTV